MNKEQFFAAVAAEVKEVEVKAIGVVLKFKVLTGVARDKFQSVISDTSASVSHYEAALVSATVVNDDHTPMFSDEDVEALRASSATALSAVAAVAMQVNGMGGAAEAEAVKN